MTRSSAQPPTLLQSIPKVDEVLVWAAELAPAVPLAVRKMAVRALLAERRHQILDGRLTDPAALGRPALTADLAAAIAQRRQPRLRRLINATGVVVHTNLGRSPLPQAAAARLAEIGCSYSNLEYDLATGKRGSRYSLVEELVCELTGAEAALVVNNNAAAVLLVLDTLARGREVVVSRGELVEIGGSFRIPDVMARTGARLVEVGATNRTHLRDYAGAIGPETALLLKVHTSNYRIIGFTKSVPTGELAELGRQHGVPVMEDLGSGCLVDLAPYGLAGEPTVPAVLESGVDVVTFSGDKLLGGPQAGLIVGRRPIIEAVKRNPLNRALRIDKFTLAALEVVLRLYQEGEGARQAIPTLAMLTAPAPVLRTRALRLARLLARPPLADCAVEVLPLESRVGGGALPEAPLASWGVALSPRGQSVNGLERALRQGATPVIGYIAAERLLLDLRTVADHELAALAAAVRSACEVPA
ncbi:MAG: L-seryl-tRNA(Sec) selenium transferase [Thermodesulfobacteriota bacterium]